MARGFLRIYRTYNPLREQDPAVDEVKTVLQDENVFKNLKLVSELSGVSESTLDNWFNTKKTKSPQNATLSAVYSAFGWKRTFVKDHQIDIDKERAAAAKWREKQDALRTDADKLVKKPKKKKRVRKTAKVIPMRRAA